MIPIYRRNHLIRWINELTKPLYYNVNFIYLQYSTLINTNCLKFYIISSMNVIFHNISSLKNYSQHRLLRVNLYKICYATSHSKDTVVAVRKQKRTRL